MRYLALMLLAVAPALAQSGARIGEQEPNDDLNGATHLQVGQQADGQIQSPVDADWYRFQLSNAQDVMVWTGPGRAQAIGDTLLEVLDAQGGLLLRVDDGDLRNLAFYSTLTLSNVAPGTYYLVVRGFQSAVGGYTLDLVSTNPGVLVPRVTPRPTFSGSEPNDPRIGGVVTVSALATRNEGVIAAGGTGANFTLAASGFDYDFFSFTMPSDGIVTIVTGPPVLLSSSPAIQDTVVFLATAQGQLLALNDNDGNNTGYSRLRHFLGAGTYWVAVSGFAGSDAGAYSLEIQGPPPAVGPLATVVSTPAIPCLGAGANVRLGPRSSASNGFPDVHPEAPIAGSLFSLDIDNVPPSSQILAMIGHLAPSAINLSQIGWTNCLTEVNGFELRLLPADASGSSVWDIYIPASAPFLGGSFEAQAAATDFSTPLGVSLSNRCTIRCGYQR